MRSLADILPMRQKVERFVRARKSHREQMLLLAVLAVVVVFAVTGLLMQNGRAQVHEERVLDCPIAADGTVVHTHNVDCYDDEGMLVCSLPEVEPHAHDDACYAEETTLACGLENDESHQHTDDCYEVIRTLACGQDENTEEHVHGPGCFQTVVVDEEQDAEESADLASADYPAQSFEQSFTDEDNELQLKVTAEAPEGALPEGTTMTAEWVDSQAVDQELLQKAVDEQAIVKDDMEPGKVLQLQAVDITFYDAQGQEVEPQRDVTMTFTSALVNTNDQTVVVHVENEEEAQARAEASGATSYELEAQVIDQLSNKELDKRDMSLADDQVAFDAGQFSTYVIATTSLRHEMKFDDGGTVLVTVTAPAEAGIPQEAEIRVIEIAQEAPEYERYRSQATEALGIDGVSLARFFDISIESDGQKLQPQVPVDVKVELAEELTEDVQVLHFADDSDAPDVIQGVVLEDGVLSFEAEGFSAYAIVEGPGAVPIGWHKVTSVAELISMGGDGLYIGHPDGYYYGNTLVSDSNRTGIKKTKPAQSFPHAEAAQYYFEQVEGSSNQVYAYCYVNGTKQYVYNSSNNNSLSLVADESQKTAFTVTLNSNGTFKFNNGSWYWNMQGGANGTRFCSYNNANDANNNVNLWYYTSSENDPYSLDGTSYGLMYWDSGLYGKALMSESSASNELDAKALMVLSTEDNKDELFVPSDSDISMWTFNWVNDDKYYLTTEVNGSTKYLKISSSELSLADSQDSASLVQVIPGTGAHAKQICLKSGNATLTYSGKTETGFSVGGSVGSEWLNLVALSELTSDYYKTYSARKVSVSDESVTTGSKVIVYTRAWNENTLKYEYYAINHDGTLVRCSENGDSIEWVGSVINTMLWQFTQYEEGGAPTYYYELYNEYAQKYLAPQVTDGQVVADDPIGINMNGRRYGQYYSDILAWDDENYSYAGLKVENGQIVSCPKSEAMDFYFAVMQDVPVDDKLTTVNTVDHTQYGITMKVVDFNGTIRRYDGADSTEEQHAVMGVSSYTNWNEQQGLLGYYLDGSGYPVATKTNKSLSQLFANAQEVNHLFIESTYNASGYYEFDSSQNFASLKGATSGDFTVYKQLGTYDTTSKDTLKHGQFLPFNDIEAGRFASVNKENIFSATGKALQDGDPRKYENLYLVTKKEDLYFGVELEASFTQTPNGLDDWGHDIIFEFTGDDDFWLYVDDQLVIDLGGIHSALPGSVNFRTGEVMINGQTTTLRELFERNYRSQNTNATDAEVAAYLDGIFKDGGTVFKDHTNHKMKIFYMERGGGASNLHMRFNLASVKPGTVELSKELGGVDSSESTLAEFAYQIKYKKKDGTEYFLTNQAPGISDPTDYVFYKKTTTPVTFKREMEIDGITYPDVFMLEPGETVVVNFPTFGVDAEEIESYSIVECGVNTDVYKSVTVNDEAELVNEMSGDGYAPNRKDYGIGFASTGDRPRVNYQNEVDPEALRTLTFTKKLYEADGITEIHDDTTVFDFRLYIGMESDADLGLANMYTYHVKDKDGSYCRRDAATQTFVSIGKSDYSDLTDDEKKSVSFTTSIYGSITKIPIDYTVEVRQILVGTKYRVEERSNELPDGYSFQKYEYFEDTRDTEPTETSSGAAANSGMEGTIVPNNDPRVNVCNLKGWGLRVNKIWTDEDYMSDRATTYFAVFIKGDGGDLTIVPDSLKELPYGTTSLYWYWLILPVTGVEFDNYVIREMKVANGTPTFNDEGEVTNQTSLTIEPIDEGGELTLTGMQKGETESAPFLYTVRYKQGVVSDNSNVRVDEATNDRPGIILKKQDWNENPLAGATFTLKDSNGTDIGTFTSDEEGLVTTAFLGEGKDYTLTETTAPQAYHGLESPMTISVTEGVVTVGYEDSDYYILRPAEGSTPATLILKNRPYTLNVIKQDGDTEAPLAEVHFELHKQVTVDGVTSFDLSPMTGYEDLISTSEGVIPLLDQTLPAGTYQLREKAPLSGYQALPAYVEFTVSETGAVSLLNSLDWVGLSETATDAEGTLSYVMTIDNYYNGQITLKKVDKSGSALTGAKFKLCKYTTDWEAVDKYSEIDLTTVAEQTLTGLSIGRYRLEETEVPTGYVVQTKYVYFNIASDGTATLTDETGTGANANVNASISANRNVITVRNIPGAALPSTGGPGTAALYVVGAVLVVLAGALLLRESCSSVNRKDAQERDVVYDYTVK